MALGRLDSSGWMSVALGWSGRVRVKAVQARARMMNATRAHRMVSKLERRLGVGSALGIGARGGAARGARLGDGGRVLRI